MAPLGTLLLAASAACASAVAVARDDGNTGKPAPFALPVYHDVRIRPGGKLRRRQNDNTNAEIYNMTSTSYLIGLSMGSPGQEVKVALDTGSSELWLNPNCDKAGNSMQEQVCDDHGDYNPTSSRTAMESDLRNTISYGKGKVVLQYYSDDVHVPGTDIDLNSVIFGYALDSVDLATGILGLSFGEGVNTQYPTLIDELQDQNVTQAKAFGVALGTKQEKTGSGVISFGGVDTKKFAGKLFTMPILPPQNNEQLSRYWVQLESIGVSFQGGDSSKIQDSGFPVFFDTGATLSYLPSNVVQDLGEQLGGEYDDSVQLYVVPCGQNGTVDFTFAGHTVHVPLAEFIWEAGPDICVLGADTESDGSYILGDSFLRSVYTVFDQGTPALHFAEYINCGSNLQMIPRGANATAKFTGECNANSINCSNVECDGGEPTSSSSGGDSGGGGGTPNSDSAAASLAPLGGASLAVLGVLGMVLAL